MPPPDPCPLCRRAVPALTQHHLVPRARGGKGGPVAWICPDCHDAIHEMFTNKELAAERPSLTALLADERFARHVRWLARQPASRRFPSRRARNQRGRGRNG